MNSNLTQTVNHVSRETASGRGRALKSLEQNAAKEIRQNAAESIRQLTDFLFVSCSMRQEIARYRWRKQVEEVLHYFIRNTFDQGKPSRYVPGRENHAAPLAQLIVMDEKDVRLALKDLEQFSILIRKADPDGVLYQLNPDPASWCKPLLKEKISKEEECNARSKFLRDPNQYEMYPQFCEETISQVSARLGLEHVSSGGNSPRPLDDSGKAQGEIPPAADARHAELRGCTSNPDERRANSRGNSPLLKEELKVQSSKLEALNGPRGNSPSDCQPDFLERVRQERKRFAAEKDQISPEDDFMARLQALFGSDHDGGKWRNRFKADPEKALRVLEDAEEAQKAGTIKKTPMHYMQTYWRIFQSRLKGKAN